MNYVIQIDDTIKDNTVVLRSSSKNKDLLNDIVHLLKKRNHKIEVYDSHEMYQICCCDIYYIENIDSKVCIYTERESYCSDSLFSKLAKDLCNYDIFQITDNILVNSIHIETIRDKSEGQRIIELNNSECLCAEPKYHNLLKVK